MASGRFDFRELLDALGLNYVPRELLEQEVRTFVAAAKPGVCVLTGELGAGKTALAGALIRSEGYLHYFLRKGQVEFGLWRDPYAFLTSIAYQLWDRFGDTIFPRTVGIDVHGRVQGVAEGGSAIGVEIGRLVPLPWQSTQITVDLDARNIAGEAVGLRIKEVAEDYRFLPLTTFREIALLEPLRRLAGQASGERLTLWVDGLDEEIDLQDPGNHAATIAALLPTVEEVESLGNLLVIASSRPGRHLDRLREPGALELKLSAERFAAETRSTIGLTIDQELNDPEVGNRLQAAAWDTTALRASLLERSGDNFLFVRHFFRGIRAGEADALRLGGLPQSLDEIHIRVIARLEQSTGTRYLEQIHPVVSVLAVAQQPMSPAQIASITRLDRNVVNAAIGHLLPFLETTEQPQAAGRSQPTLYAFFHQTFRDSLRNSARADQTWFVGGETANGRIADYYLTQEPNDWHDLDEYGFAFLTEHLRLGSQSHRHRLVQMVGEPWRRVRRSRSRSNRLFEEDLGRAVECLPSLPPNQVLPSAAKVSLMAARIHLAAAEVPTGAVELMARLGQHARALEYVVPGPTGHAILTPIAEAVAGLAAAETPDWALLYQLLETGLRYISRQPDHGGLATLLEACPSRNAPETWTVIERAIALFNQGDFYWATPPAITQLGRLVAAFDPRKAAEWFQQCLDLIPRVSTSGANIYHATLLTTWAEIDPTEARRALERVQWVSDEYAARTVLALARKTDPEGRSGYLRVVLDELVAKILPAGNNPYTRALVLVEIARAAAELGDAATATDRLAEAAIAADAIGSQDDPERELGNRWQQATDVWIYLAECTTETGLASSKDPLERAWHMVEEHADFNGDEMRRKLVRAQQRRHPLLLEARLDRISESRKRAGFLVAAAAEVAGQDPAASARYLERALMAAESSTRQLGNESDITLAIALRFGAAGRDAGDRVLHKEQTPYDLTWRFAVLDELMKAADPTASGWLWDAVRGWATELDSSTLAHAAALALLPDHAVRELVSKLDQVDSVLHRALLAGVLSARCAEHDPAGARRLLSNACETLNGNTERPSRWRDFEALALFAGQWWKTDRALADAMWTDALLLATTGEGLDRHRRSSEFAFAIRALMLGAPEAALGPLLCYEKPPPDPSSLRFVLPGATTPPLLAAGLLETDYQLGLALADAMARGKSVAGARFHTLEEPAVASMAAALAAFQGRDTPLEQRAQWCEAALALAARVKDHYVRCLLRAMAAEACLATGLRPRARELAGETAQDILDNGDAFGAVFREPAYAHALGKCVSVLAQDGDRTDLVRWIWEARILLAGLPRFLAYLPGWIENPGGEQELERLSSALNEAMQLFS